MAASSALICRSRTSGFGETVCGLEKGNAMHNAANNTELCMVRTIAQKARSVFLGGLEPPGQILSKAHYYGSPTSWRFVGYTEAIHFDGLSPFRPCGRDLVEFFNSTGWAFELTRWRGGRYRVRRTRHCWSR